jgi:hypothetical protein
MSLFAISSFAAAAADVTVSENRDTVVNVQFQQIASVRQAVAVTSSWAPSSLTPDPLTRQR